jgi:hypothetical protein
VFPEGCFDARRSPIGIARDGFDQEGGACRTIPFVEYLFQILALQLSGSFEDRFIDDFSGQIILLRFAERQFQRWIHLPVSSFFRSDLDDLAYLGIVV